MTIESFCRTLADLLTAAGPSGRLEGAARAIAGFFGAEPHEVGFFQVDRNGVVATFCWPPTQFGRLPNIPIKSFGTSLLSTTAREQRGFIDNTFATTPHLHILEHVLAEREQRIPVQKIMSVPIIEEAMLRSVLQVSRKGKTAAEAGADFTPADLEMLEQVATVLARFEL